MKANAEKTMEVEDAEEFTQALGQIVSGSWRQVALAHKLGVPRALGFPDTRSWVEDRLGGYVKLSVPERREVTEELKEEGFSNRAIGQVLGVHPSTVDKDVAGNPAPETEQAAEDEAREDVSAGNPAPRPEPQSMSEPEPKLSTRELLGQSDQNDWRTPRKFLDAAHAVMGGIDLDPATGVEANETVRAKKIYTEEDNGLEKPWKGRVWLNPPYGGDARLFIERLIKEYEVGNVTQAITLVNSHPTETKWFQRLFDYTICFVAGRIDFGGPSREVSSTSTHGSAIVYLGKDIAKFSKVFGKFGAVVQRAP
jgi:phage N-6-adenine-methyltransferase